MRLRLDLASAQAVDVSAASIWEIAIKAQLGKIEGDAQAFAAAIEASGFKALAVTAAARDGGPSARRLWRCSRVALGAESRGGRAVGEKRKRRSARRSCVQNGHDSRDGS
jgi:hypothetical protein